MTTNTPTPAPDVEARVAVLWEAVNFWQAGRMDSSKLYGMIRAELQKPALHEPVTDAEVASAIAVSCEPDLTTYGQGMRKAIESFLQGRAKPAQEEITDAEIDSVFHAMAGVNDFGIPYLRSYEEGFRTIARAIIRASKGEKT